MGLLPGSVDVWAVVGAVAAILGVVAMIAIAIVRRTRKVVSCLVHRVSVLTIEEQTGRNVRVLYERTEVRSLDRVRIRFRNSGNRAIAPSDFVRAITIKVPPPGKVLSATVTRQKPDDVSEGIVHTSPQRVTVNPLLMNPKDEFSIDTLIGDLEKSASISGRIIAGKIVRKEGPTDDRRSALAISAILAQVAAAAGALSVSLGFAPLAEFIADLTDWLTLEAFLALGSSAAALLAMATAVHFQIRSARDARDQDGD